MSTPLTPTSRRFDHGTTLVEVVIALLVLTVGLIATAAVAAQVTRMVNESVTDTRLATLVSDRLEILAVDACRAAAGEENRLGFRVRWSVAGAGAGRRVTVMAGLSNAQRPSLTVSRFVACPT